MIYTHVVGRGATGTVSPLDTYLNHNEQANARGRLGE